MKRTGRLEVVLVSLALILSACKPGESPPGVPTVASTNAAPANPEFQKLCGQWVRPDGGYVLEVRTVGADGIVDAGYFNPAPIRVHGARVFAEAGNTKLFVELRDVNYPGCTYNLTYDPKTDQLYGVYFQAAQQQTYDVTFGRQQ